jgi:very-short-patch-repair endonuclease
MNKVDLDLGHAEMDLFLELPRRCQDMIMDNLINNDRVRLGIHDLVNMIGFERYAFLESPIEKIFGVAADIYLLDMTNDIWQWELYSWERQVEVKTDHKKYRVDFMFDSPDRNRLIVECDGHDFHEKTRQQVEYGNDRDYYLKKAGYDILHFSGRQIYRDPFLCAEKVYTFLFGKGVRHGR